MDFAGSDDDAPRMEDDLEGGVCGINTNTTMTKASEANKKTKFQKREFRLRMILAAFSSSSINTLLPLGGGERISAALLLPLGIHSSMNVREQLNAVQDQFPTTDRIKRG